MRNVIFTIIATELAYKMTHYRHSSMSTTVTLALDIGYYINYTFY